MKEELKLGWYAKDTITGFKGMLIGVAKYLHGNTQWLIQPVELYEGSPVESEWFDEGSLDPIPSHEAGVSDDS